MTWRQRNQTEKVQIVWCPINSYIYKKDGVLNVNISVDDYVVMLVGWRLWWWWLWWFWQLVSCLAISCRTSQQKLQPRRFATSFKFLPIFSFNKTHWLRYNPLELWNNLQEVWDIIWNFDFFFLTDTLTFNITTWWFFCEREYNSDIVYKNIYIYVHIKKVLYLQSARRCYIGKLVSNRGQPLSSRKSLISDQQHQMQYAASRRK